MRAVILAAMLATAAAEPTSDQFDLVCTAKSDTVRYRIDLATRRYCAGECKSVRSIEEVSASEIVLVRKEPTFQSDSTSRAIINRSTGAWHTYAYIPGAGLPITRDGTCEKAAFSGLPAAKF